jgi:hypothetical protein
MSEKSLLLIDAIINLLLGVLLGIFPRKIVAVLGLPIVQNTFYASILGAVLFGIGIALLLEMSREKTGLGGLGLGGAIAINLSGGLVLALWLVFGALDIPTHGFIVMWLLVAVLFVISAIELAAWKKRQADTQ